MQRRLGAALRVAIGACGAACLLAAVLAIGYLPDAFNRRSEEPEDLVLAMLIASACLLLAAFGALSVWGLAPTASSRVRLVAAALEMAAVSVLLVPCFVLADGDVDLDSLFIGVVTALHVTTLGWLLCLLRKAVRAPDGPRDG